MKILSLCLIFLGTAVSAQNYHGQKPEKNIPTVVSAAFDKRFPHGDPIWFSDYENRYNQKLVYEGRFLFDNRYSTAVYDKEGNLLAFAAQVERNEIPQKALKYMTENFPTFPIVDSILVTTHDDEVTYELGIVVDGEYIVKVFSKEGDFIKSTRA
ncbi:MAG: hypothetical protein EOO51_12290 [Flavobacterium sp.]|nr:MAG: hypothetical protein EOO51_12290 [Flavobacterium sp.]